MARPRYPKSSGPLPPPLSPATRTVGQLVAETLRLYGDHFFLALPLGLVIAVADQASLGLGRRGADHRARRRGPVAQRRLRRRAPRSPSRAGRPLSTWVVAIGVGDRRLPAGRVPVPLVRARGDRRAGALRQRRAGGRDRGAAAARVRSGARLEVARADLVHALGGLATLRPHVRAQLGSRWDSCSGSRPTTPLRVAIFLADTVLGPILFLGGALLYVDLAARVGTTRAERLAARAAEHGAAK